MGNSTIYYSGHPSQHIYGVGFVVKNTLLNAVLQFKPINDRIWVLRLKGKFYNTTIINAYAPTDGADEDRKEEFYGELDRIFQLVPTYD